MPSSRPRTSDIRKGHPLHSVLLGIDQGMETSQALRMGLDLKSNQSAGAWIGELRKRGLVVETTRRNDRKHFALTARGTQRLTELGDEREVIERRDQARDHLERQLRMGLTLEQIREFGGKQLPTGIPEEV